MVLITGASGFIGGALLQYLSSFYSVRALVRCPQPSFNPSIEYIPGFDLSKDVDLSNALEGVKVVVHCAARVHVMNEAALDPLEEFRRINLRGTVNLALQAAQKGVKRFIYISSIKVNGESTKIGKPFSPDDIPSPSDAYGLSKYEAESALQDLAVKTGMEVVIIRPPLVYGHGVKANFAALIRLVKLGIPLPFGLATKNRRSFVAIDNLISFIKECIVNPKAANQVFFISDGQDLSTTSLIKAIALASNKSITLIPIPVPLLNFCLKVIGKHSVSERLFGNLQVDISKCYNLLGWIPPIKVNQALRQTIAEINR